MSIFEGFLLFASACAVLGYMFHVKHQRRSKRDRGMPPGPGKPRLFFYDELGDDFGWRPVEHDFEVPIEIDDFIEDREVIELRFQRRDLTDKQYEALGGHPNAIDLGFKLERP